MVDHLDADDEERAAHKRDVEKWEEEDNASIASTGKPKRRRQSFNPVRTKTTEVALPVST